MNITIPTLVFCLSAGALVAADAKKPGYKDTPTIPGTKWHVHDSDRPHPPIVKPAEKFSQGATAPADAIVLFDGKDFSKWKSGKGGEVTWKIENGYMEVTPKSGIIRTADEFGDFQLHLEWATPAKVESEGQGRGNNGVNIFGRYEVQVLESYQSVTYADGQAGALYGQYPPLVNASRPPGEWQSYDIVFRRPRFDASGKVVSPARFTVFHNGVLVQDNAELIGPTANMRRPPYEAHADRLPISLQDHGHPVRFRNVWIRDLEKGK